MVKRTKADHGRAEWRVVRSRSSATGGSSASSATSTMRAITGIVNRSDDGVRCSLAAGAFEHGQEPAIADMQDPR